MWIGMAFRKATGAGPGVCEVDAHHLENSFGLIMKVDRSIVKIEMMGDYKLNYHLEGILQKYNLVP